jgi:hypothetical protein
MGWTHPGTGGNEPQNPFASAFGQVVFARESIKGPARAIDLAGEMSGERSIQYARCESGFNSAEIRRTGANLEEFSEMCES